MSEDSEQAIRDQCAEWLRQAIAARRDAAAAMPPSGAPPPKVAEALVTVRAQLDLLETIYLGVMMFRSAARARARQAADTASSAWDTKSAALRRVAVGDRYQSGDQHRADVNLEILPVLTVARTAQRVADLADDTSRQVELLYKGLDGARHDLGTRLRYLQWELAMER